MSYRIDLLPRARADLARLPRDLRIGVGNGILDLADSPAGRSRPGVSPPHPPGYMMMEFEHIADPESDTWHHFVVLFRYGQDEATLYINGVGHTEFKRS